MENKDCRHARFGKNAELLLRFPQRRLGPLALGDVLREYHDPADPFVFIVPGPHFPAQPVGGAVFTDKGVLFPALDRASQTPLMDILPVFPVPDFREYVVVALPDQFSTTEVVVFYPAPAGRHVPQVGVKHGNRCGRLLDEGEQQRAVLFEALLCLLALGDVGNGPGHAQRLPLFIPRGLAARVKPSILATLAPHTQLDLVRLALLEMCANRLRDPRLVILMDLVEKTFLNIGKLMVLITEPLLPARRQVIFAGRRGPLPNAVVGAVHRAYVTRLALAHRLLGALAIGDVLHRAGHASWLVLSVIHQFTVTAEEADRAIRRYCTKLQFPGLFSRCTGLNPLLHRRPVLRMNQIDKRLDSRGERLW